MDGPLARARRRPAARGVAMDHDMRDKSKVDFKVGPGVDMIAPMPMDRTGDPGIGLENVGHKVLTYRDLVSLTPNPDHARPDAAHRDPPDRQHGAVHVVDRRREAEREPRAVSASRATSGCG